MFSEACVCSRRGVSIEGGLCGGGPLSWEGLYRGRVSIVGGSLSWEGLYRGRVSIVGGSLSWEGLCPGVLSPVGMPRWRPTGGHCRDRYASYWDAFLFPLLHGKKCVMFGGNRIQDFP